MGTLKRIIGEKFGKFLKAFGHNLSIFNSGLGIAKTREFCGHLIPYSVMVID